MVRDQLSRVDGERATVHFLRKKFDIFEQCETLHYRHEQRVSPVVLWLELSQCCKDIITIVLGVKVIPSGSATIKENPNGFYEMVIMIFRSWIVYHALSGGVSPGRSQICSWFVARLSMTWVESRIIARNKQIDH
jgi:hypothetical protein